MSFLKSILDIVDPAKAKERDLKRYEHEKKIAKSLDLAARLKLAKSPATQAEILYFLAEHDSDIGVRSAVAANDTTPYQANRIIVADKSDDVRLALAGRLVRLLPGLSEDKQSQLYAFTIEALDRLARDEVSKIRTVLAQTLKDQLHAPPEIVNRLARDIERQVAEPILRHCTAVSDDVLLDILQNHPASWTIEAIAQRRQVSASVSDAVIDAYHETAGALLLENKSADISQKTLAKIVEKAKTFISWQNPLAIRPTLPLEMVKKLAEFADQSVRALLAERTDIDSNTMEEISGVFRRRLESIDETEKSDLSVEDRVRKLIAEKALNEEAVVSALGIRDKEFVIVAMAAMVRTSRSAMENIVSMSKAKPIIAVCHKAGFSMRTCLRIQQEIALVPSKELILPKGGTDYPLDAAEIKWQLDFLGLS